MEKIYDIKPPEKEVKNRSQQEKEKKNKNIFFGMGFAILLTLAMIFFFSYRVEIDIWPTTEGVEISREFSVDINEGDGATISGTIFETDFLEEYREFKATGYEDEETRATGMLTVQNKHWSQNQPLIEGTRFENEDGLIFKAKDGFVVPGGNQGNPGEIEVEVEADGVGEEYNIGPSEFSLPGLEGSQSYQGVTAYSSSRMTGGAVGERTVVSEEDIENARAEIIESLLYEGRNILESGKSEQYLMEASSQYRHELQDEDISAQAGEAAENFSVRIRARVDVLTFEEELFKERLFEEILAETDSAEEGGLEEERRVYEESLSFNYDFLEIDWNDGRGRMEVDFVGEVYSEINNSRLKERARGSSRGDLAAFLENQDFIRRATIRFRPFGFGGIPENRDRIRVNLQLD